MIKLLVTHNSKKYKLVNCYRTKSVIHEITLWHISCEMKCRVLKYLGKKIKNGATDENIRRIRKTSPFAGRIEKITR